MTGNIDTHYTFYIDSQIHCLKNELGNEKRKSRPFVTISRDTEAYGITIAEKLCEYLKRNERRKKIPWTLFDKELIKKVAQEHGLPERVMPYLSESVLNELQDMVDNVFGLHPSKWLLAYKTRQTILHLAQLGYVIIVGRGANFITAQFSGGIHIRLISSFEQRVERIQEYLKITKAEAREHVISDDRNHSNYVRKYFGKNVKDPLSYDVLINIDNFETQQVAEMIGLWVLKHHQGI